MKKLLFAAYSLDVGGIEKALVNLVNVLQNRGYDITVVLEKKQGIFLNELNKNIKTNMIFLQRLQHILNHQYLLVKWLQKIIHYGDMLII